MFEETGRSGTSGCWKEFISGECVSTLSLGGAKTSCWMIGLGFGLAKFAAAEVCFAFVDVRLLISGRFCDFPDVVDAARFRPLELGYG